MPARKKAKAAAMYREGALRSMAHSKAPANKVPVTAMADTAATSVSTSMGTSQFDTDTGAVFTSSNTSPGTANTFNNRAARDIRVEDADGGAVVGSDS